MGRARRRLQRRHASSEQRSFRLPCGCDAAELAAQMGMSIEELLRAAERAEQPYLGDGPVLVTFAIADPPRSRPPGDDAHLRN